MKKYEESVEVSCRTCEHAEPLINEECVLCEIRGVVSATSSCRKFIYDALKRVPPKKAPVSELEFIDIDE